MVSVFIPQSLWPMSLTNVRADAYKYVDGYTFSKVVSTQTFADTLVYLCKKSQERVKGVVYYDRLASVVNSNALELTMGGLSLEENKSHGGSDEPSEVSLLTSSLAGTAVNEVSLMPGLTAMWEVILPLLLKVCSVYSLDLIIEPHHCSPTVPVSLPDISGKFIHSLCVCTVTQLSQW